MAWEQMATALGLERVGRLATASAAQIVSSPFSVGCECLDRDMWNFDRALPHIAALGAKWARVQTGWAKCERTPGIYDFAWLDDTVDRLLAVGMQPWFNVGYGNRLYTPGAPHATAVGWTPVYDAASLAAWQRFTAALAEHFRGRVSHYEVWNEPDIAPFWTPLEPSPAAYTQLVTVTAAAVRAADPAARIVGGSLACGLSQAGLEYTEICLESGLAEAIDVFSYHNYTGTPEVRYDRLVPALWALVHRYRPGLPLWQGESGAPSLAQAGQALAEFEWDETRQAKWDARRALCDLAAETPLIAFFHASDFEFYIVKDQRVEKQYYFGLIGAPEYEPKPAYYAAQTLCTLFAGQPQRCPDLCPQLTPAAGSTVYNTAQTRTCAFSTAAGPILAWWQGHDMMQTFEPRTVTLDLWMPHTAWIQDPVLVEPISQQVYALPACEPKGGVRRWQVPLVDWPLLLVERPAVVV